MANPELPFEGKKVYFSVGVRGQVTNPDLGPQLVKAMQVGGATVLDEHVVIKDPTERLNKFLENSGLFPTTELERDQAYRKMDLQWVDEATHLVAVVDGPSIGVGMELERALSKPERGLNLTPILTLVHHDNLQTLSAMVKGVIDPQFKLCAYYDIADAKRSVARFLR